TNGQAFGGELRATRLANDLDVGPVVVTLATTLSSRYGALAGAHPDESDSVVRAFLGIPENVDLGEGLRYETEYFGATAFLEDALANGGVDSYLANLAEEVGDKGAEVRHYPGIVENDFGIAAAAAAGATLTFAGSQLGAGAAQYVGFHTMPYVLRFVGVEPDPTPRELMQTLVDIDHQLSSARWELSRLRDSQGCETAQWGYDTLVQVSRATLDELQQVAGLFALLGSIDARDPKNATVIANTKRQIRQVAERNHGMVQTVGDTIVGSGGTRGLIRAYSDKIKACGRFLDTDKSDALIAQNAYLTNIMVTTCNLMQNYRNDEGQFGVATQLRTSCEGYYAQLRQLQLTPIPADTYFDHTKAQLWRVAMEPKGRGGSGGLGPTAGQVQRLVLQRSGLNVIEAHEVVMEPPQGDPFWDAWRLPYQAELRDLFGTCTNPDAATTRSCLMSAGLNVRWSSYDGFRFLWASNQDSTIDLSDGARYRHAPYFVASNGTSNLAPLFEFVDLIFIRKTALPRFVW
ncbi:MAG: hypothetical protein ABL961_18630, partial [Vicinamibacterales bacterium]